MRKFLSCSLFYLLVFLLEVIPAQAATLTPSEEINRLFSGIQKVFEDETLTDKAKVERVLPLMYAKLDMAEMSRLVLIRHWNKLTESERKTFVEAFTVLIEKRFLSKVGAIKGAEIIEISERIYGGDDAWVNTKVKMQGGSVYEVNYRILKVEDGWKICGVELDGISLVSNFRSQYERILKSSTFEMLIGGIRAKSE